MGVTNRDASLLTQRNRDRALYSYKSSWTSATVNSVNPASAVTGPATTGTQTLTQANLGCVACTVLNNEISKNTGGAFDPNQSLYPANPSRGGAQSATATS